MTFFPSKYGNFCAFFSTKSPLYPFVHFALNLFLLPWGKILPKKAKFKLGYRVHDFVGNEVQA
jgi:hypothetical protein